MGGEERAREGLADEAEEGLPAAGDGEAGELGVGGGYLVGVDCGLRWRECGLVCFMGGAAVLEWLHSGSCPLPSSNLQRDVFIIGNSACGVHLATYLLDTRFKGEESVCSMDLARIGCGEQCC